MHRIPQPFFVRKTISNLSNDITRLTRDLYTDFAQLLSMSITDEYIEKRVNDFTTDYEVCVYVLTPDELEKLIQDKINKRLLGYYG
jgi:predicted RNA-binding protein with PIN domain